MTRKDEKDTERPHYYSQFWLDVAAGRREIGGGASKIDENADADDMPEPTIPARKVGRATATALVDGHRSARDIDDEDFAADETFETGDYGNLEMEEDELASDLEDEDIPNILVESPAAEEPDDADLALAEEEAIDDEEYFDEEEDEDEDEEDDWSARGRKKPKPGRQVKAPKPPAKKPKRGGRSY
jgi:hypothetical protein